MASAARPFSTELVTLLISSGVVIASITLHAGVSSAEPGEPPAAERFDVPTVDRTTGQPDPQDRRAGDRGRNDGDPRTGVGRKTGRYGARRIGLDRPGARAGPTRTGGRWPDHRLARRRRLASAAARGGRWSRVGRRGLPRSASITATCGMNSATARCCCQRQRLAAGDPADQPIANGVHLPAGLVAIAGPRHEQRRLVERSEQHMRGRAQQAARVSRPRRSRARACPRSPRARTSSRLLATDPSRALPGHR